MSKEIIYEVGDVVTIKVLPGGVISMRGGSEYDKGKIIYKDVNPATLKSILGLESIGDWIYMIKHNNNQISGPYKYYQLNKDE